MLIEYVVKKLCLLALIYFFLPPIEHFLMFGYRGLQAMQRDAMAVSTVLHTYNGNGQVDGVADRFLSGFVAQQPEQGNDYE